MNYMGGQPAGGDGKLGSQERYLELKHRPLKPSFLSRMRTKVRTTYRYMVRVGAVLARAVRWHLERRVVITGNKTVVFA